jgi:hypothetical protein
MTSSWMIVAGFMFAAARMGRHGGHHRERHPRHARGKEEQFEEAGFES